MYVKTRSQTCRRRRRTRRTCECGSKDEGRSPGSKRPGPECASASKFEPPHLGPYTRPLLRSGAPQLTIFATLMVPPCIQTHTYLLLIIPLSLLYLASYPFSLLFFLFSFLFMRMQYAWWERDDKELNN